MENLFTYGMLKNPKIQRKVIGRAARKTPALLLHYKRQKIKLDKTYPAIVSAKNRFVKGFVISVKKHELKLIDKYETSAYKRKLVKLKSNKTAWVYVKSAS